MPHRSSWLLSVSVLVLPAICFAQVQPSRTLVRTAHLVDVHAGRLLDAQTLVVSGDRIAAVEPTSQVQAQPGDTLIDLGNPRCFPA